MIHSINYRVSKLAIGVLKNQKVYNFMSALEIIFEDMRFIVHRYEAKSKPLNATPGHTRPRLTTPNQSTPPQTTQGHDLQRHITLCLTGPRHVMPGQANPSQARLGQAMAHQAMLCYTVLCQVRPGHFTSYLASPCALYLNIMQLYRDVSSLSSLGITLL